MINVYDSSELELMKAKFSILCRNGTSDIDEEYLNIIKKKSQITQTVYSILLENMVTT
jgi:hypothetical protein